MPFSEPPPPYDYIADFTPDHRHSVVAEWQAHVEAGRIGTRPAMAPPTSPTCARPARCSRDAAGAVIARTRVRDRA